MEEWIKNAGVTIGVGLFAYLLVRIMVALESLLAEVKGLRRQIDDAIPEWWSKRHSKTESSQ